MRLLRVVLIASSALVGLVPAVASAQGEDQAERPEVDERPEGAAALPPRTLGPAVLPLRVPRREVGIAFGVSAVSLETGVGGVTDDLTTVTGALYLETRTRDEGFGVRMQLPVASADAVLVGDIDMDFAWIVLAKGDERNGSFLSLGLDFVVPTSQLNTLGGGAGEIRQRRLDRYPTVSRMNQLPIRYLQMLPHVGYMHRVGELLLFADVGPFLLLGCRFPNYYDSPQVEAALQYGLGATYELVGTPELSVAAGLELSGTHFFTTVAPALDNGPTTGGGTIAPEPRDDRASGLSLAPSARVFASDLFAAHLGVSIALLNEQTFSRYTPSNLWMHDWTVFVQAGLGF